MAEMTEQLRQAVIDLCLAVTPYGEDEDGWITRYIVSSGPVHRLVGAAQGAGISAALRAVDSDHQSLRVALHLVPEGARPGDYSTCSCGWTSPTDDHRAGYDGHLANMFGGVRVRVNDGGDHVC